MVSIIRCGDSFPQVSCDNSPNLLTTPPQTITLPAPLPFQTYSWKLTCGSSSASGSFEIDACQQSSDCHVGSYCAVGGSCVPFSDPNSSLYLYTPVTGDKYQVGQTLNAAPQTSNISPATLAQAQINIYVDGNPVAANLPGGGYQAPSAFTAAGTHQVSADVELPNTRDIQGLPVVLARSKPVSISVIDAPHCDVPLDCTTPNTYCAASHICLPIPQVVVTLAKPIDSEVDYNTNAISFVAQATPFNSTDASLLHLTITANSTVVCQSQNASCSNSTTLAVGSYTVTAAAYVDDYQGKSLLVGQSPTAAIAVQSGDNVYSLGQILVKYKDGVTPSINPIVAAKYPPSSVRPLYPEEAGGTSGDSQIYIVLVPSYADIAEVVKAYTSDPNVEYAQPNLLYKELPAYQPNDYYWNQKNLPVYATPTIPLPYMWYLNRLRWPEAIALTPGRNARNLKIADFDTGIDSCHPDLGANIDFADGIDITHCDPDPLTGRATLQCQHDYPPSDINGHGTAVAGVLSAIMDNGIGVSGMSQSQVVPIQIFQKNWYKALLGIADKNIVGSSVAIAKGIKYVLRNKLADVILIESMTGSNSVPIFGGPVNELLEYSVVKQIKEAISRGVTVVLPAGNEHSDIYNIIPQNIAGANKPIVVAAVGPTNAKEDFSNFGFTVDVAGFGELVATTKATHLTPLFPGQTTMQLIPLRTPTGQSDPLYQWFGGTSAAGAQVAGAAALLMANFGLNPSQVRDVLSQSADYIPDGMFLGNSPDMSSTQLPNVGRLDLYHAFLSRGPSQGASISEVDLWGFSSQGLQNIVTNVQNETAPSFPSNTTQVTVVVKIPNVKGCLVNGTVMGQSLVAQPGLTDLVNDQYYFDFTSANSALPAAQTYFYRFTCVDLWGGQTSFAGNFKVSTLNQANSGGTTVTSSDGLNLVKVHPNPWKSSQGTKGITFDQLSNDSSVKIFTLSGRWMKSLSAPSGSVTWDLTTDSGDKAASGLYLYVITDLQGNTTRGKLTVIR